MKHLSLKTCEANPHPFPLNPTHPHPSIQARHLPRTLSPARPTASHLPYDSHCTPLPLTISCTSPHFLSYAPLYTTLLHSLLVEKNNSSLDLMEVKKSLFLFNGILDFCSEFNELFCGIQN